VVFLFLKAKSFEVGKVTSEMRWLIERLLVFCRKAALRWDRLFIFLDTISIAYFVFVSAITDEKVTSFLTQVGFRADISENISGAVNSIWAILIMFLLLVLSKFSAGLRGQNAECLREELDKSRVRNVEMEETLSSLTPNLRTFYSATLQSMLRKVGLEDSPNVRISVYLPSSDQQNFMPAGRYSHNATYRSQGRTLLPFSQGCIGKAWDLGRCEWRQMSKSLDARKKKSKQKYDIPNATFDTLRMKTLSIGAYRIDDNSRQPVGLVVIESDDHGVINFNEFENVLEQEKTNIERLISSTHRYLTDPNLAKEAGV
jgi:hypothetical protein